MKARSIIEAMLGGPVQADPYVTLVSQINSFLDDGNLADHEKTRDLATKAKHLANSIKDEEKQAELKRLAGVLIGHYRYYAPEG
jgi:hypothetical protein